MQLEDYFEIVGEDDIRIKGHRIGIDDVLKYYLQGYAPEQILAELPSLGLEKIYATITYYLHNRTEMDAYLRRLNDWREQHYQAGRSQEPTPMAQRLRVLKAERARQQASLP